MLSEQDFNEAEFLALEQQAFDEQYALALKYQVLSLKNGGMTPTDEYAHLLSQYEFLSLPPEVMVGLEAEWRRRLSLGYSGSQILKTSRYTYRSNQ